MESLLQPAHLFFILLSSYYCSAPASSRKSVRAWGAAFRICAGTGPSSRRSFMAQGVDPKIGRDVGDMLPDRKLESHQDIVLLPTRSPDWQYNLLPSLTQPSCRGPDRHGLAPGYLYSLTSLDLFARFWVPEFVEADAQERPTVGNALNMAICFAKCKVSVDTLHVAK